MTLNVRSRSVKERRHDSGGGGGETAAKEAVGSSGGDKVQQQQQQQCPMCEFREADPTRLQVRAIAKDSKGF